MFLGENTTTCFFFSAFFLNVRWKEAELIFDSCLAETPSKANGGNGGCGGDHVPLRDVTEVRYEGGG